MHGSHGVRESGASDGGARGQGGGRWLEPRWVCGERGGGVGGGGGGEEEEEWKKIWNFEKDFVPQN